MATLRLRMPGQFIISCPEARVNPEASLVITPTIAPPFEGLWGVESRHRRSLGVGSGVLNRRFQVL